MLDSNTLSMLQNAILDAVEAYVDSKLSRENLPFSTQDIGVIDRVEQDAKGHYLYNVRVGSKTRYKLFKNCLALGNMPYDVGNVVMLMIPSGNTSESYVLGKLDTGAMNYVGGSLKIGAIAGTNPTEYNFSVNSDGEVDIRNGGIRTGWNDTLQDYNFKVTSKGIQNGLYFDTDTNKNNWYFTLDSSDGSMKMTRGSIKLGKITSTKYRFEATEEGVIKCRDNDGNVTFQSDENGVTIRDYLHNGAFDTNVPTNATRINGACVSTGYIKSPNLRGQDDTNLDSYDGQYTTAGMIIGLEKGFLSSKNFNFASNGDCHFRGDISAATGTIGGWSIGSTYLYSSVGSGTAYISSGKVHVLSPNYGWQQVCINPSHNRCYLSGIDLYIDNNAGDLNGDSHSYGGTYLHLTPTGISYHDRYWISENSFKFLDYNEGDGIEKLRFIVHSDFVEIGNRSSGNWGIFFL